MTRTQFGSFGNSGKPIRAMLTLLAAFLLGGAACGARIPRMFSIIVR